MIPSQHFTQSCRIDKRITNNYLTPPSSVYLSVSVSVSSSSSSSSSFFFFFFFFFFFSSSSSSFSSSSSSSSSFSSSSSSSSLSSPFFLLLRLQCWTVTFQIVNSMDATQPVVIFRSLPDPHSNTICRVLFSVLFWCCILHKSKPCSSNI